MPPSDQEILLELDGFRKSLKEHIKDNRTYEKEPKLYQEMAPRIDMLAEIIQKYIAADLEPYDEEQEDELHPEGGPILIPLPYHLVKQLDQLLMTVIYTTPDPLLLDLWIDLQQELTGKDRGTLQDQLTNILKKLPNSMKRPAVPLATNDPERDPKNDPIERSQNTSQSEDKQGRDEHAEANGL